MKFGCCVTPEHIKILAEAGYDFCELPARCVQPFDDDTTALPALRELAAAPLRPEAFNLLVPPELPLVGPYADVDTLQAYLQHTFTRMAQLGGVVAVLGSGGARRLPEDMPRNQALIQLAEALKIAQEEAQQAGITLAIEHLNQQECNVLTSVAECYMFLQKYDLCGLRLIVDLHHLEVEAESLTVASEVAPLLAHVHVAGGGRLPPQTPGYDYAGFMATLHNVGYNQRISVECCWDDLATQAGEALAFMRNEWQTVTV
ncbi:MAG: sugar phosphate isomerase/epimerase [Chloroflexi bacterium AL-W]|nr:sugar phosphate isomerase/epimerase [Chloroflexi bacterium AL-N1]NOK66248.1 sugar phosphate isomerase/epimerase [Chloroflexi bacterium AL-N10]NOK73128.1 sugar phosphate isomerase/epimerase [Chloroflexi bacterium AL-N5]NOK80025.1 sugar phosphate isomerase/epimerase [Chloroflexi bacterium AL-W]NOK88119.1 sugar phosphate isomerase/epimerase [Chloroflexi bacterium AL-N15]